MTADRWPHDALLAPEARAIPKCRDAHPFTLRFLNAVAASIAHRNLTHQLQVYGVMPTSCDLDRLTLLLQTTRATGSARTPTPRWLIFFVNDDYGGPIPLKQHQHVLIRTSLNPPFDDLNVHAMPYLPYDIPFPPHFVPKPRGEREDLPVVGFCGVSWMSPGRKSLIQAISAAEKENHTMRTLFVMRNTYFGGPESEFNQNMNESHFIVASRGVGNFAMRLYQTMAAGRIPVLTRPINTMRLPLENVIPWRECLVQAPSDTAVVRRMLQIWNTGTEVERRQRRCAAMFREWFDLEEPGGAGYVEELVAQLGANTSAGGSIYKRAFNRTI